MSLNDFDLDKAREIREKVKSSFAQRIRKDYLTTLLISIPFVIFMVYAGIRLAETWMASEAPETARFFVLLYLLGLVLIALLWGNYALKAWLLFFFKEIKQLRLDSLAERQLPPETATGGAESFNPTWPIKILRPRMVLFMWMIVFVLVPVVTAITYTGIMQYRRMHWAEYEMFGGQEMVTLHLTADGTARAISRVSITRCPSLVSSIPIRIAQPDAKLESAAIDNREIPIEVLGNGEYNIIPGLPENALKTALLEVVWTFPIPDPDLRIHLQGLIPVNSYAVNAVLDEGAPYRFIDKWSDKKSLTLFWTKRPVGQYDAQGLGSCGMAIEARIP
jgi:hypothetical protein